MKKHRAKLLFLAIMAMIPVLFLIPSGGMGFKELGGSYDIGGSTFTMRLEDYVGSNTPFKDGLVQLGLDISIAGGQREIVAQSYGYSFRQNGIFAGESGLIRNIDPAVRSYVQENTAGIIEFSEAMRQERIPTYMVLIPTSGAILPEQELPRYARSVMVNQRQFIEGVYNNISGSATTIDAYSALLGKQWQYIYYRTENNLTALGGYYIYASMLSRMGLGTASLGQFDIDYADNRFYGDLYNESRYKDVSPDQISLFRYSATNRTPREYLVTHVNAGSEKTYHTLFPQHLMQLQNKLDVYLGGISAVTDIRVSSPYSTRLLIFGDKTALAYLPFLANHCERATLVDLFHSPGDLSGIDPRGYDKVIFAYGVESYMHTNNPSRAVNLLDESYS